jgi:hypothetical protein
MSKELKPCPNPECKFPRTARVYDQEWPSGKTDHWVRCKCEMRGPFAKSFDEAERLWNVLPRTDYKTLSQKLYMALEAMNGVIGYARWTDDIIGTARKAFDTMQTARNDAKAAGLEVPCE